MTNSYRLLVDRRDGQPGSWFSYGILLFAGPCVLFENSTRSFRRRECSALAYGFALGLAFCWSSLLGLALVGLGHGH